MNWSSPYARICSAAVQEWPLQHRALNTVLKGDVKGVVIEIVDVSIDFHFHYKGVPVKDLASFCAWVEPEEEAQPFVNHWGIDSNSEAEIVCRCKLTKEQVVLGRNSGQCFMTRLFAIDRDATESWRVYSGTEPADLVNGVIWSTRMDKERALQNIQDAKRVFYSNTSRFDEGWRETLSGLLITAKGEESP